MGNIDQFTIELIDDGIKIFDGQINQKDIKTEKITFIDNLPFSFFTQDVPDISQKLADQIKKAVTGLRIGKKKVNLIIPDAYTYSQIIPMPTLNEKELISAIKYQADQFIPLPIDNINIDLEVIYHNEKEKNLLVLVAAVPKKLASRVEETIELAGLIPLSLENQLSSFGRFINQFSFFLKQNSSQKNLFINLDKNNTSLYFFDQSLSLISKIHTFNFGYNLFLKEIQINTSFDYNKISEILLTYDPKNKNTLDLETIISPMLKQYIYEIKKIINTQADVFLIGEVYRFPALSYFLNKHIDLPISFSVFNPYPLFKPNPQIDHYKDKLSFFVTTIGGQIE